MLHQSLYKLRDEFRNYATSQAPDILSFCGDRLFEKHDEIKLKAADPTAIIDKLQSTDLQPCEATKTLTDSVIDAAPHLTWQQSYTTDDPGIDQHYLENYGWFNLIAPSRPFVSNRLRISVGYWGKGLTYPNHWHEPEEIYLTLAGSALYLSHGREPVRGGPGTTICHYSNQPHSASFDKAPLLAAAFWRGKNLESKSHVAGAA